MRGTLETQAPVPVAWRERYGRRLEEDRLPTGQAARPAFVTTVGTDGLSLLAALNTPDAPARLRELPAVARRQRVGDQHCDVTAEQPRLREPKELPPAAEPIATPHDPEARDGLKRGRGWTGDKAHLTETCDDDRPLLITHVATTLAPEADVEQLAPIQADLADNGFAPDQHLVDAGYVRGRNLVSSREPHGIDLIGPVAADHQGQAKTETGVDVAHFQIDWGAHTVTCPGGRTSARWCQTATARSRHRDEMICPRAILVDLARANPPHPCAPVSATTMTHGCPPVADEACRGVCRMRVRGAGRHWPPSTKV